MSPPPALRLAELMAALSIATDLGLGQPLEFALRGCILAVRLAERCGYSEAARREVYYQALLRYIGCNAETDWLASVVGDEQIMRADFARIDNAQLPALVGTLISAIRQSNAGASPLEVAGAIGRGLLSMPGVRPMFAAHCEVAQRLAGRLGFEPNVVYALGQLYERWDGQGLPNGLKGEAIAPAVLVVALAQDMALFHRLEGLAAAVKIAGERRGGAYAPALVDVFVAQAEALCAGLEAEPAWDAVLALEPGTPATLDEAGFDQACQVLADFVDIKSDYTLTHSSRVAELAREAARRAGLPADEERAVWRAALVKEIGRTGISSRIWEKPGPLTQNEWERVRLHTYYAERVLARSPALARLGALAAAHHERLDGSGYHRGQAAAALPMAARLLAAADVHQSLTEARPYRPARPAAEAAQALQSEARAGRLDPDAVASVLAAAGHAPSASRKTLVAGLTAREAEVLALLARGQTLKQIAARLIISAKTVDSHVQHIYSKIGVKTRAGATLFAMQHGLLGEIGSSPDAPGG